MITGSQENFVLVRSFDHYEYPFEFVEDVLFNKLIRFTTPHWQQMSRATAMSDCLATTAMSDCFATYEIEKKKLKILLRGVDKVNITTDMWTLH
jgi:hypothetical protein